METTENQKKSHKEARVIHSVKLIKAILLITQFMAGGEVSDHQVEGFSDFLVSGVSTCCGVHLFDVFSLLVIFNLLALRKSMSQE